MTPRRNTALRRVVAVGYAWRERGAGGVLTIFSCRGGVGRRWHEQDKCLATHNNVTMRGSMIGKRTRMI